VRRLWACWARLLAACLRELIHEHGNDELEQMR